MPRKNGKLTPQERMFTKSYAETGSVAFAVDAAKYCQTGHGHTVLSRPKIQAEVRRLQEKRLVTEALPIAVQTLIDIMSDTEQRGSARVAAANIVIKQSLGEKSSDQKEPHEMTAEELAAAIEGLQTRAMERAKDVTPGPDSSVFD